MKRLVAGAVPHFSLKSEHDAINSRARQSESTSRNPFASQTNASISFPRTPSFRFFSIFFQSLPGFVLLASFFSFPILLNLLSIPAWLRSFFLPGFVLFEPVDEMALSGLIHSDNESRPVFVGNVAEPHFGIRPVMQGIGIIVSSYTGTF